SCMEMRKAHFAAGLLCTTCITESPLSGTRRRCLICLGMLNSQFPEDFAHHLLHLLTQLAIMFLEHVHMGHHATVLALPLKALMAGEALIELLEIKDPVFIYPLNSIQLRKAEGELLVALSVPSEDMRH